MHVYFTRWDQPQQQYQKRLLSAEVQAGLTAEARVLLALDDRLNDEDRHALHGAQQALRNVLVEGKV